MHQRPRWQCHRHRTRAAEARRRRFNPNARPAVQCRCAGCLGARHLEHPRSGHHAFPRDRPYRRHRDRARKGGRHGRGRRSRCRRPWRWAAARGNLLGVSRPSNGHVACVAGCGSWRFAYRRCRSGVKDLPILLVRRWKARTELDIHPALVAVQSILKCASACIWSIRRSQCGDPLFLAVGPLPLHSIGPWLGVS